MYITNNPEIALIAQECGVNRIFVDMEYLGKEVRQSGMDTVKLHHTIKDIQTLRPILNKAELLVRVNPIHDAIGQVESSKEEIDNAINAGADILMLPMIKTKQEAEKFIELVGGRAKTMLLIETAEANENIDQILEVQGIDEIHVGLNDMHLAYKKRFMFELLVDGTVERLCKKFKEKGIPYGFGGIASLGKGAIPAEKVIAEHYRLGSTGAILSRSFCNINLITDIDRVSAIFDVGLKEIRAWEQKCEDGNVDFIENKKQIKISVEQVLKSIG
jgi:hypothetical protein